MNESTALLLALAVLYLTDCVLFVHRQGIALVAFAGRRFALKRPGSRFGNARGALQPVNPLPPLGTALLAHPLPVSISADGVCAYLGQALGEAGRPPQRMTALRFEDIASVDAFMRDVRIDGRAFVSCRTERAARFLARWIRRLKRTPREGRAEAIRRMLHRLMNPETARRRYARAAAGLGGLRAACNAMAVYLFVICPAAVWRFGCGWLLAPLAAGGLVLHAGIMTAFARRHRRLRPGARHERTEHLIKMALCPPMDIRAADAVTVYLLDPLHPLAAAAALAPEAETRALAETWYRDLRYPLPVPSEDPLLLAVEADYRALLAGVGEDWLRAQGLDPEAMVRPPEARDEGDRSYCPRCRAFFGIDEGTCADCGGRALEPCAERAKNGETGRRP